MGRRSTPRLLIARLLFRTAARRAAVAAATLAAAATAGAQIPVRVGGEFRVNTTTTRDQLDPAVAMNANGGFVVVWTSYSLGGVPDIYAQRYGATGVAQGPEFRVNTYTTDEQLHPSVAMGADGDFVVVWMDHVDGGGPGQDGDNTGIHGQRYDAAGAAQGTEFQVNTYTTSGQRSPSVAMSAGGSFVVAWTSSLQKGSPGVYGVFAQLYAADGAPVGEEFQVNTYTTGPQGAPSVAMNADGDFVVAWSSLGQDVPDTPSYGVFAQRYAADGAPVGGEFRANTTVTGQQVIPSVAMDAGGGFVVAWEGSNPDNTDDEVFARRYTPDGAPVGAEILVNTYTLNRQEAPSVAMDAGGGFVVAWESDGQDGDRGGVFARRYTADGSPAVEGIRANTRTNDQQRHASVAIDADGDFVVVWQSVNQEGLNSNYGIYGQRYTYPPVAAEPPPSAAGLTLAVAPSPLGRVGGRVRYTLPEAGPVRVAVYDLLGREAAVLVDGAQAVGAHEATLGAAGLAPGVYVVRLTAGASTVVRRVTVGR